MVYKPKYDYLSNKEALREVIAEQKQKKSIIVIDYPDQAMIKLNFLRAENELKHAEAVFKISSDVRLKREFDLLETDTFYSGAITHAYYAVFFAAKALLMTSKIETKTPNVHKATLDAFANYFIINGKLDLELLKIYQSTIIRADFLLELFVSEKEKRGEFTYKTLPDANKEPAHESINNATKFLINIKKVMK